MRFVALRLKPPSYEHTACSENFFQEVLGLSLVRAYALAVQARIVFRLACKHNRSSGVFRSLNCQRQKRADAEFFSFDSFLNLQVEICLIVTSRYTNAKPRTTSHDKIQITLLQA